MLLASDLDGTLIATEEGQYSPEGIERFRGLFVNGGANRLAYVSGRGFELALAGVEENTLPRAEFLICDVGTSIYQFNSQDYELSSVYQSRLKEIWGSGVADEIDELVGDFPFASQQGADCQTEYKRSFFVALGEDAQSELRAVELALEERELSASVVFSVDPLSRRGLLDVLPQGVNKEFALRFLLELSGCSREEVVYAGDSGNDLAVFSSTWNAIMVSNTPQEVKDRARSERPNSDYQLFEASQPCIEGVLEGCEYFGITADR
jgi:HAD superfamily hydrolase (TIGR01484 family)